jgi:choline dehydrogenase-like flavoprotein
MSHMTNLLTDRLADLSSASSTAPFDVVVVGGGTSAVTVALTFAERGRRVALLEAGPLLLTTNAYSTDLRYQRDGVSQLRRTVEYAPGYGGGGSFGSLMSCLGGRSLFWAGTAPRLLPHELDDWPLTETDLHPYYDWIEAQFQVSSDYGDSGLAQAFIRHLRRSGWDFGLCPLAVDTRPTLQGWIGGTVGNAVSILLRQGTLLGETPNPRIAVNAFASRLLLGENEVRGVLAMDREEGRSHEVLGKAVVLAAGAFESARLAVVSGVRDASGRLGRYISDHLLLRTYCQVPLSWYEQNRYEVALAICRSRPERPFQVELQAPAGLIFSRKEGFPWYPASTRDYTVMIRSFGSVEAREENHVEARDEDKPGSYVVHLEYSPQDLELRERMRTALLEIGRTLGAGEVEVEVLTPGRSYHEAGGLGMGTDAATSVTDPGGRFWKYSNLFACDASVWPSTGATSPHVTIGAIARRNATLALDHLPIDRAAEVLR